MVLTVRASPQTLRPWFALAYTLDQTLAGSSPSASSCPVPPPAAWPSYQPSSNSSPLDAVGNCALNPYPPAYHRLTRPLEFFLFSDTARIILSIVKVIRGHDLVKAVRAKATFLSEGAIGAVLDTLSDVILNSINDNKIVEFPFGQFRAVTSAPRFGFNIQTKERIQIPSKRRIRFTPSLTL